MGAAHQGEQGEWIEDGEHEGGAGVVAEGAGQLGDAVGDEGEAGHGLEAQQDHGDQRVVEAQAGRPPGQHQEEGPVGGRCVQPERVDGRDVRTGAEGARTVVVRVDVAAHHFALGGVREHVAAEERGHHHERHQPEGQHVDELLDGHARAGAQRPIKPEPDPHEEDHSPVDGNDAGEEEPGRVGAGRTEEPGAAHLELEGRTRERGADADGEDGDEAEDGGLAQEGPVAGVDRVGLDALGQGAGGAHAQAQCLSAYGEATQARRGSVQH